MLIRVSKTKSNSCRLTGSALVYTWLCYSIIHRTNASHYLELHMRREWESSSHVLAQLIRLLQNLIERERSKRPTPELGEL